MSFGRTRYWQVGMVAVLFAWACAPAPTLRDVTYPAGKQGEEVLTTFAVKPPQNEAWRIKKRQREASELVLLQADYEATLGVIWQPVLKHETTNDVKAIVQHLAGEEFFRELQASPDIRINTFQQNPDEIFNGLTYQHWEMTITYREKQAQTVYSVNLLSYASSNRLDVFVCMLAVPQKAESHVAECVTTMRDLLQSIRYLDYSPGKVALPRLAFAYGQFSKQATTEGKNRDPDKLRIDRENALAEADHASQVLPNAPEPWNVLGLLSEYNTEGFRYGDGFDAVRAEQYYQTALQRSPTFSSAHENLAALYEVLGRTADAEQSWRAALVIEPSNWEYHYKLGRFYEKQNRNAEALDEFRQALRFWRGAAVTKQELEKEVATLSKKLGKK